MKLKNRVVEGIARLELEAENVHERAELELFCESLNERPVSVETNLDAALIFSASLRVESVGFAEDGSIESIALEEES